MPDRTFELVAIVNSDLKLLDMTNISRNEAEWQSLQDFEPRAGGPLGVKTRLFKVLNVADSPKAGMIELAGPAAVIHLPGTCYAGNRHSRSESPRPRLGDKHK
jgi:hypothetical protein